MNETDKDVLIRKIWDLAVEMRISLKKSDPELDAELASKFSKIDRLLDEAGYFPERVKR